MIVIVTGRVEMKVGSGGGVSFFWRGRKREWGLLHRGKRKRGSCVI